jgi:DNA-directed RNA polymerase specialized sigma24 family protein
MTPETFEAFYIREYAVVLALAAVLSGSAAVAEDITQEAFVAAFRQWHRVGAYDQPGAWVRRVVANQGASAARRRVRDSAIVARLAGRRSAPSQLTEFIAEILKLSESTVRVHLHAGRQTLATRLREPYQEDQL